MWEEIVGTLGLLTIGFLAYMAGLLQSALRRVRDANARAKEDRAASEQRDRDIRTDFTARADRDRGEFKAQAKEYRDLSVREHAQLSKAIAELSRAIAELSKAVAEQSKGVATLQVDVQVLLDRSDRSSGGKAGTTRYEFARQASPTRREEEHGEKG